MIAWLLACAGPAPTDSATPAADAALVALDGPRLARRVSLDLRGALPSADELDRVEADPAALDALIDEWMADPRLEDRLVDLLGERWLTMIDVYDVDYYDFGLAADQRYAFARSVGEEPLRLAAYIGVNDLPWSELVTADYTVANELLAQIWPLDYPAGGSGWQVSSWTDGRPAAGVLASNGLWWRYTTNPFNQNRTRAAALFRLFACTDFLARPVSFTSATTALDATDRTSAVLSDPYCLACHAAIEPAATTLWGFWWATQYSAAEMTTYHAERETQGSDALSVSPAWFGEPVAGLQDLGRHIAADPRFERCAVETWTEALWRRDTGLGDFEQLAGFQDRFVEGGQTLRPLLRAILASDEYRAAGVSDAASEDLASQENTARLLAPELLDEALQDLTGFSWTFADYNQLRNDGVGYRILGGGVNGLHVLVPQRDPSVTWELVSRRATQAAAYTAVTSDLSGGEPRRVLQQSTTETRPEDAAFRADLSALGWRLYGERPSEHELDELAALWAALEPTEGAEGAWVALVGAMMRDPRFLSY